MSTQRAFVIQFLPRPDEAFCGRVEHVGTGEAAHFASPDELMAFLHRLHGRSGAERPPREPVAAAAAAAAAGARDGAETHRPPPRTRSRRGGGPA